MIPLIGVENETWQEFQVITSAIGFASCLVAMFISLIAAHMHLQAQDPRGAKVAQNFALWFLAGALAFLFLGLYCLLAIVTLLVAMLAFLFIAGIFAVIRSNWQILMSRNPKE